MHAFLTGGTGFLGGELVRLLVGGGWKVTALHRPSSEMTRLRAAAVTPVEGTLEDADSLRRAMPEGVDAVFHVAAVVSFWSRRDQEQTRANVIGTRNVVEAALASGAGRFVHTSSIAAFGRHAGIITESTPSNAASSDIRYLQTKALAEEEVRRGMDRGLDAVFLNPANILGPGDSAHWAKLLQMVDRGHLPGLPPGRGSFCHVREVALAHLRAFERGRTGHHYLLGGADADYAVVAREAARILGRTIPERTLPLWAFRILGRALEWGSHLTGKEPAITPEKASLASTHMVCSSEKASRELGYRTPTLTEMLEESVAWLRSEGLLSSM